MDRENFYARNVISYSPENEHSNRLERRKTLRKKLNFPHFAIESEQIKTNDTNQIKTERNNNTLTGRENRQRWWWWWWLWWQKSSSSSRLVIYFSVITQTFKRTYTRVHTAQIPGPERVWKSSQSWSFHCKELLPAPTQNQSSCTSCKMFLRLNSVCSAHTNTNSNERTNDGKLRWKAIRYGSKVD